MLILEILGSDECLDIIDSKCFINGASCTLELAVLMADSAADCRERVVSLDQFKSSSVFASAGHIDIALDSYMERTCRFARSSTCRPCLDDAVFVLVIPVPLVLRPDVVGREFLLRILDLSALGAELLSESDSACRADLYALSAGYALLRIDLRTVWGSRKVRSVEKL